MHRVYQSYCPPRPVFAGRSKRLTISPHTTACRYSPLLLAAVRNPSLPASNLRQSDASSCATTPAVSICAGVRPNMMHFPIRLRSSSSERAFGVVGSDRGGRASGADDCVEARRVAAGLSVRYDLTRPKCLILVGIWHWTVYSYPRNTEDNTNVFNLGGAQA